MNDFERLTRQQPAHVIDDSEAQVAKENMGWTRKQFAAALCASIGLPPPGDKTIATQGHIYRLWRDGKPTNVLERAAGPCDKNEQWILERDTGQIEQREKITFKCWQCGKIGDGKFVRPNGVDRVCIECWER